MNFPFQILPVNTFDAVGFGTNAVDHLIGVPEYPAFGTKVELTVHIQSAGGEVASAMAGLNRLGLTTAYAGRFGSDQAGELGRLSLVDEGVDIGFAQYIENAETQVAFILIDERSGERTIVWKRDERLSYSEHDAPLEAAVVGRVLHLTPHDTKACAAMARAARRAGVIVSLDIDNVFDGLDELLTEVDVMIASAEFPGRFLGIPDTKEALREIVMRFGCSVAGITLGSKGSVILCDGSFVETPGFAVPGGCKDTTGAGDAFRTGFLFGMLSGEPLEISAVIANAVAALKCTELGARKGLPNKETLEMFLRKM